MPTFSPAKKFTQEARHLRISTSLADDLLLLRHFSGAECISQPFQFHADLLSHSGGIEPRDIVGEKVCMTVESDNGEPRFVSGFVKSFQYSGLGSHGLYSYKAEIVPWIWFLSKRRDCRVFQNLTVQEIIESIFNELGFSDYVFSLVDKRDKKEYCVQYGETDLDFISRLLEHEGIFYFFEHEQDKHTLHLADDASHYTTFSPREIEHNSGTLDAYYIHLWQHLYQYCSGGYVQTDFDYEKFNQSLLTETSTAIRLKNNSAFPLFDFPGNYHESERGRTLTKLRMQQEEMNYELVKAASNIHSVALGKKFILTSDESPKDHNEEFVITEIRHDATDPSYLEGDKKAPAYQNTFCCIPASTSFRPLLTTPKPRMDGVQTAVVVGPSGDEIYTDKYGRIKLQFHWDRYGSNDEKSSCWVRVATQWAGAKWGSVGIPRVGQEVVVTFVNGDPDQPLVIGSVYNSAHMPPYSLPENKTMAGTKSRSSKGGDPATYNEIVIDDKNGAEQIRINAQKDFNMNVGKDAGVSTVGNSTSNVDGNATATVKGDASSTVDGNTTQTTQGNESSSVAGDRSASVGGNETCAVSGNSEVSVGGDCEASVGGKANVNVGSDNAVNIGGKHAVTVGASQSTSVGADQTVQVDGKQEISAKSQDVVISTTASLLAADITVDGTSQIALTVGGSSVTITPEGITLSMGASSVKIDLAGVTVVGPIVKLN